MMNEFLFISQWKLEQTIRIESWAKQWAAGQMLYLADSRQKQVICLINIKAMLHVKLSEKVESSTVPEIYDYPTELFSRKK